ncbi:MAG: 23S rRNA (adenine(2503)-C(2))-methyltransferase RlmN [Bacteroidetes bacterium]|nr:23S rRNA (adenine(2503)-C(2))-methyltransferase RlmN [Bacteroidota bacterium]
MNQLQEIKNLSLKNIESFFIENKEKAFRAKQVYEWLWQKHASSFDEMTNISKEIRSLLKQNFSLSQIKIKNLQKSSDKTIKTAFELSDGNIIEGVLIPAQNRATACISSQVGCKLGCKFCATGHLGYTRNLTVAEIYDQVVIIKQQAEESDLHFSNIVLMGMGEPLLNYDNVMSAIKLITSKQGLAMSNSRITLSTSGINKMIKKLADDNVRFNLAVSLHSANNDKRSQLMPVNKTNPLNELAQALKYFNEKTQSRITFEYLLIKDINDGMNDAKELAIFCKNVPCKINIIEYNPIDSNSFKRSTKEKTDAFVNYLENKNIIVNIRRSRGKDIDAACGQLANKN